jgi:hypothetical protein
LQLIVWSFSYGRSWLSAAKLAAPCFSTVDACLRHRYTERLPVLRYCGCLLFGIGIPKGLSLVVL